MERIYAAHTGVKIETFENILKVTVSFIGLNCDKPYYLCYNWEGTTSHFGHSF